MCSCQLQVWMYCHVILSLILADIAFFFVVFCCALQCHLRNWPILAFTKSNHCLKALNLIFSKHYWPWPQEAQSTSNIANLSHDYSETKPLRVQLVKIATMHFSYEINWDAKKLAIDKKPKNKDSLPILQVPLSSSRVFSKAILLMPLPVDFRTQLQQLITVDFKNGIQVICCYHYCAPYV